MIALACSPAASCPHKKGARIALYFTGRQHAGENLRNVLAHRAEALTAPVQMSDALSRTSPLRRAFPEGVEVLLPNCLAHGRRQFVEVAANFPEACRYVLETQASVYKYDAEARAAQLSPQDRLLFHQQHSEPIMTTLQQWMQAQLAQHLVEPNSGLGKAITYFLRHRKGLAAFLRDAGAPLDNNICERALKRAALHHKNALFYRTLHGSEVGDLFMSLIHTRELCDANPFEYLTELQRHASEQAANPSRRSYTCGNAQKTSFSASAIQQGFWPPPTGWLVRSRFHARSTDNAVADPCPAGVRS
jgi:transposase